VCTPQKNSAKGLGGKAGTAALGKKTRQKGRHLQLQQSSVRATQRSKLVTVVSAAGRAA
jgi:hypothetical protein